MDTPAELAVKVTLCADPTAETAAVNAALLAPAATVTAAGTATEELLLAKLTLNPVVGAGALNRTVHTSFPIPVIDPVLHESELNVAVAAATPVPVRLSAIEFPAEELVERFNLPVTEPALVGLNFTVNVRDWPGFNLAGKVPPDTEKPVPCTETEFTSSGQVPTDDSVTDCVAAVFIAVLPNARLVVLTLIVDTTAFRLIA